ncbi:MAG TPA: TerB family tellurite resistance protein [Planctomycetota bacterium]
MSTPAEEAFWNLVAAARAEDVIRPDETRVLNAYVLKLGLDPQRAKEIQAAAEAEDPPRIRVPKEPQARLDTLRAVLEVAAADGTIGPKELAVVRALAERCAIPPGKLGPLLAVALRRSTSKLDKAFAALKSPGDAGPELIEFKGPVEESPRARELLRRMPFAARLAPPVRSCASCRLPFGNRDPYAQYCRPCVVNAGMRNWTGCETLAGSLFLLFLFPAAYLVQKTTGLWSWGYYAGREMEALDTSSYRYPYRRRPSWQLLMLIPAAGVTVLAAWLPAWGISELVTALLRKSESPEPGRSGPR